MNGILVDSCVILDIVTKNPSWYEWSAHTLENYCNQSSLYINQIIYSEISIGFHKIEEIEEVLPHSIFKRRSIPWEAAFLAGKIFLKYRKAGGQRILPLPDFFIGAHATIEGLQLLTRDSKRFKHYYPNLKIISPNQ